MLYLFACDDTLFGPVTVADTGAILAPTYDDVAAIWSQRCSGCHTDGGAQAGLSLDAGESVLVGVASTQVPTLSLVSYGDPEGSYLWLKITDAPEIIGSRMPQGAALSDGEIGTIANWIVGVAP
jgi:mono/diheme cytochrome c family protein